MSLYRQLTTHDFYKFSDIKLSWTNIVATNQDRSAYPISIKEILF